MEDAVEWMIGTMVVSSMLGMVLQGGLLWTAAGMMDVRVTPASVVGSVLLGDGAAFVAALLFLVPGCCTSATLGVAVSMLVSLTAMWIGRGLTYQVVLRTSMPKALALAAAAGLPGLVIATVSTFWIRWVVFV